MAVYFRTIPACIYCRQRKSRCDVNLPSCGPCRNAGIDCIYVDPRSKERFSRQHIYDLESELRELEKRAGSRLQSDQIGQSSVEAFATISPSCVAEQSSPSNGSMALEQDPGIARSPDSLYFGSSSGVHLARSVLEAVRQNGNAEPYFQSQQLTNASTIRPGQPVAIPAARPPKETAHGLIEVYFSNCEVQYPILSKNLFYQDVVQLYEAPDQLSPDMEIKIRFRLHMVLAIALLFLSRDNLAALGLAENYYESAMQDLMAIMKQKDLATIQCLLLIFLYSFFNSTRAPMWYLAGLSMRMCVDLGLHTEEAVETTIEDVNVGAINDERRRIFWVTYTLDRTLSIILGRPLSMRDGSISVGYLSGLCEDNLQQNQMNHWIQLQRLQSEIVSQLSVLKDLQDEANLSVVSMDWYQNKQAALTSWRNQALRLIDSNVHTVDWWTYWYHTTYMLLLRPALRVSPSPSLLSFYTSSIAMIQLSFIQQSAKSLSMAWTTVHHQFTAGTTLLFVIWHSTAVRSQALKDWMTVKSCLVQCGLVLEGLVGRWQSAVGAGEVLKRLAGITVEVLEKEMRGRKVSPGQGNQVISQPPITGQDNSTGPNTSGFNITENSPFEIGQLDESMFPPMFGEDLTRSLYADPAELYGFDYLNSGFLDEIDWSATESPLNFQGRQTN